MVEKITKKRKYDSITMNNNIESIEDLINIIETYDINFDEFKLLKKIYNELIDLSHIIGMKKLKKDIVKLILYEVQELDSSIEIAHHICITGGPGMGKTEVSKIIARILLKIKGWNPEKFFIATKTDLVGRYVGQTPSKVQDFIDKCKYGCLFIDEVYSLGSSTNDSFDKELIDTLVHNLSENKNFICIIAGYKKETEELFFSKNPGLQRRFGYFFNIEEYTESDLFLILKRKIENISWIFDIKDIELEKNTINLIKENKQYFKYYGGDIIQLLKKIKIVSSQRTFCVSFKFKKIITFEDIVKGLEIHKSHYKEKDDIDKKYLSMYI